MLAVEYASVDDMRAAYKTVRARLRGAIPKPSPREPAAIEPQVEDEDQPWFVILREVAEAHDLSVRDVRERSRFPHMTVARHEVFYRLRHELGMTYEAIDYLVGGFSHKAVLMGVRNHVKRVSREVAA